MRHRRKPIGGSNPPLSASYYVFDMKGLTVFLGGLFSAVFTGVTVPCHGAVYGRDGLPRDFGRSRHENLSKAISWLTFLAGGAANAEGIKPIGCGAKVGAWKFTR